MTRLSGERANTPFASWDAEHEVVVIFGGEGSHEGTWTYDPWENTWTQKKPPKEPEPRSGGNMAYDPRHKVHVLFGSQFDDDQHTWIYDLNANAWSELETDARPPTNQNDTVLTYDSSAGLIVAVVKITTPHFSSANSFTDPTHRHHLGWFSLDYFTGEHEHSYYTSVRFRHRVRSLLFHPTVLNKVIRRIANRWPAAYERRWAWMFPAWFLYFELEVIKDGS